MDKYMNEYKEILETCCNNDICNNCKYNQMCKLMKELMDMNIPDLLEILNFIKNYMEGMYNECN